MLLQGIEGAGYRPGEDVYLGLDVAASELYHEGAYKLAAEAQAERSAADMIAWYEELAPDIRSCRSRMACMRTIGKAGGVSPPR